jgi:uncharacterized membrane protein
VLLLAFLLRVVGLAARPLWYDEAFAVLFAEKGFSAMLAGTLTTVQGAAADVHPIAYYSALNGWMQLAGESPVSVRALSVFAGVLTVALVYALGRHLFGRRAALIGMIVAAGSPFLIYYSQEARMYAPLALFCGLTVLCFLNATRTQTTNAPWQTWLNWLGVSVFAAAALYMQNLAAIFLLALGLSTVPRPKVFLKLALAGAGAFVLWLPWFVNVSSQLAKLQQAYWVTQPTALSLLQTLMVYHGGEEMLEAQVALPLVLFAALVLPFMLGYQLFKARRAASMQFALGLTALAFGPLLLLFLASFYTPVYIQRALLPAAVMYAPLLGWLLAGQVDATTVMPSPIRWGLGGLLGLSMAFGLWAHYTFEQFPRPNFPEVVAFLTENVQPRDRIIHSNKLTFFPVYYYNRALPQVFLADPPGSGSDTLALPTQQVLNLYSVPDADRAAVGATHIWFFIFNRALSEYAPDPHPHLQWLKDHYLLRRTKQFGDLALYEFVSLNP